MQESKKLVQESISGGKIWNRKSMPVKERPLTRAAKGRKRRNTKCMYVCMYVCDVFP